MFMVLIFQDEHGYDSGLYIFILILIIIISEHQLRTHLATAGLVHDSSHLAFDFILFNYFVFIFRCKELQMTDDKYTFQYINC